MNETLPLVSKFNSYQDAWDALTEEEARLKSSNSPLAFYSQQLFVLEHIWRLAYMNLSRRRDKESGDGEYILEKDGVTARNILERLSTDDYSKRRVEAGYPTIKMWEVGGELRSKDLESCLNWLTHHIYLVPYLSKSGEMKYLHQGIFAPMDYNGVYHGSKDPRTNDEIIMIPTIREIPLREGSQFLLIR